MYHYRKLGRILGYPRRIQLTSNWQEYYIQKPSQLW